MPERYVKLVRYSVQSEENEWFAVVAVVIDREGIKKLFRGI
jgi:hypothetical protein